MPPLRLVVGLGNPGSRYAGTRHNAGFRLVERLAGVGAAWKEFSGFGRYVRREALLLAEPMTFMNESGSFVGAFCRFHKIKPEEALVCFDDVALPIGRLRLRPSGSSGGQKGMQSIIESLGTLEVPRLRIGVGPQPPGMDSSAFVLGRFTAEEEGRLEEVLQDGCQAIRTAATESLDAAMNRFNKA